jgi:uncharacterized protein
MDKFWQTQSLAELNQQQWESLCDGCGKCCLHKLEDSATGQLFYTNAACHLLNLDTGRCTRYAMRSLLVPDCVQLTPATIRQFAWLPSTCAYRLLAEGSDLPAWHPLVSGDAESVRQAGMSVSGWAVSEQQAPDLEQHILTRSL